MYIFCKLINKYLFHPVEVGVTKLQEDEALILMYSKIRDQDIKMTDRSVVNYINIFN